MKSIDRLVYIVFGGMLVLPVIAELPAPVQEPKGAHTTTQDLPPGEVKDLLIKQCSGCHQLTVVTSQHKSESAWTDTIIEMRNRGANGSDEDMEQIIRYLTTNFGPQSARGRGVTLGGLRGSLVRMKIIGSRGNIASAVARRKTAAKRNEDLLPVIFDVRAAGENTPGQIAQALNERGITAAWPARSFVPVELLV